MVANKPTARIGGRPDSSTGWTGWPGWRSLLDSIAANASHLWSLRQNPSCKCCSSCRCLAWSHGFLAEFRKAVVSTSHASSLHSEKAAQRCLRHENPTPSPCDFCCAPRVRLRQKGKRASDCCGNYVLRWPVQPDCRVHRNSGRDRDHSRCCSNCSGCKTSGRFEVSRGRRRFRWPCD